MVGSELLADLQLLSETYLREAEGLGKAEQTIKTLRSSIETLERRCASLEGENKGLQACLTGELGQAEVYLRTSAECDKALQQLAEAQTRLTQQRVETRKLQCRMNAEERSVSYLQQLSTDAQAAQQASVRNYEVQTAELTAHYEVEMSHLRSKLATAEQQMQALQQDLQQERKTFEASLLSRAESLRSTPWKEKLLAVRAELEAVKRERDMLARRQL